MTQTTRIHRAELARLLLASWLALFLACSFGHIQPHGHDGHVNELALAFVEPVAAGHVEGIAAVGPEMCGALQALLLNQQLLAVLGLALLLSLAPSFRVSINLLHSMAHVPLPATAPGIPPPIRKQLHRYND